MNTSAGFLTARDSRKKQALDFGQAASQRHTVLDSTSTKKVQTCIRLCERTSRRLTSLIDLSITGRVGNRRPPHGQLNPRPAELRDGFSQHFKTHFKVVSSASFPPPGSPGSLLLPSAALQLEFKHSERGRSWSSALMGTELSDLKFIYVNLSTRNLPSSADQMRFQAWLNVSFAQRVLNGVLSSDELTRQSES
ncbi:uncharacterized [Tachysurus ichikawai]